MAYGTNLVDAFQPLKGSEITGEAAQNQQNVNTLKALTVAAQQDSLVRNTIAKHTVTDPSTGQMATDQNAVVQDLYLKDPNTAAIYQKHVQDLTAEKAAQQLQVQKAQQENTTFNEGQTDRVQGLLKNAIGSVDPNADLPTQQEQYKTAIGTLKAQGVPLDPSDEVFSPGRVAFWRRQLIGVGQLDKDETQRDVATTNATGRVQAATVGAGERLSAAQIAAQSRENVATIGAGAKLGVAGINQGTGTTGGGHVVTPDSAWAGMVGSSGQGGVEGGSNADGTWRISPKGAIGPAQLTPAAITESARLIGVKPADVVSDPKANLAAGRAYFNKQLDAFDGDIPKAVAAYNAGPGNVQKAIAKATATGNAANYAQYLPQETQKYLNTVVGGNNVGGGSSGDPQHSNNKTVQYLAQQYRLSGKLPPLGQGQGPYKKAILSEAAYQAGQQGKTASDDAATQAGVKADQASLTNMTKFSDTTNQAEATALKNFDAFLDARKKIPGQTSSAPLNSVIQGAAYLTGKDGGTIKAAHNFAMTAASEYARAITGGGTSNQALTDSAQAHAMSMISAADSPATLANVRKQLQTDMQNRYATINGQKVGIGARISNAGKTTSVKPIQISSSSDYASAPSGSIVIWNGKRYKKP